MHFLATIAPFIGWAVLALLALWLLTTIVGGILYWTIARVVLRGIGW